MYTRIFHLKPHKFFQPVDFLLIHKKTHESARIKEEKLVNSAQQHRKTVSYATKKENSETTTNKILLSHPSSTNKQTNNVKYYILWIWFYGKIYRQVRSQAHKQKQQQQRKIYVSEAKNAVIYIIISWAIGPPWRAAWFGA